MSLEITSFNWKVKTDIDTSSLQPSYALLTIDHGFGAVIKLFITDIKQLDKLIETATKLKHTITERGLTRFFINNIEDEM